MSPLDPRLNCFTGLAGGHETSIACVDKPRSAEHMKMSSRIHQVVARTAQAGGGLYDSPSTNDRNVDRLYAGYTGPLSTGRCIISQPT